MLFVSFGHSEVDVMMCVLVIVVWWVMLDGWGDVYLWMSLLALLLSYKRLPFIIFTPRVSILFSPYG